EIVFKVAGDELQPDGPKSRVRKGLTDFELRDEKVRYKTTNGTFIVSYREGFPVSRFEADPLPPEYPNHQDLTYVLNERGERRPVQTPADWAVRREQIRKSLERVMGPLPGVMSRVPLDVKILEETKQGTLIRRKVSF